MRDKYVEERFPCWSAAGSEMDVHDSGCNGAYLSGEAIADEHNRTVEALCDAVQRLSPEQQAEWLAAWPIWRPPGEQSDPPLTREAVEAALEGMSGINSVARGQPATLEPPTAENPLMDPISFPPGMKPGQLAVEEMTRAEAVTRFNPLPGARELGDKSAQCGQNALESAPNGPKTG